MLFYQNIIYLLDKYAISSIRAGFGGVPARFYSLQEKWFLLYNFSVVSITQIIFQEGI